MPACASAWLTAVYPRVCGGSPAPFRHPLPACGLSPRVRGKPAPATRPPALPGSIPACAGEARWPVARRGRVRVYPRVCGGSLLEVTGLTRAHGLSPRVRGKPLPLPVFSGVSRSIPACAGEAPDRGDYRWRLRVYPRVCGGSHFEYGYYAEVQGLSPRVRGKPWPDGPPQLGERSIPACAGEARRRCACPVLHRVYPRVCGGSSTATPAGGWMTGLSPRVRGKRLPGRGRRGVRGSIPACAGEALWA